MAVGNKKLIAGIDVGSTTTKIVVLDAETKETVYSDYRRHHASQLKSVLNALKEFSQKFPGQEFRLAMTGSGSKPIAEKLGLPFVQEVVANSIALRFDYEDVGTAIELGGQDAKMIFFGREGGHLKVNDMRMNGSCAGGTGAFIDEVASILKVSVQEINSLAEKGSCVYDISGRCGVYAKTDIQPLLNQGISKADLALSSFHAIAKQTIGGLAQGLDIKSPVVFEGGPLTFNPVLIKVFAERLNLEAKDILNPAHPEVMIAKGAALSLNELFPDFVMECTIPQIIEFLEEDCTKKEEVSSSGRLYFYSEEEKQEFFDRHKRKRPKVYKFARGETIRVYLGIDSGSTTTKFVLLDEDNQILDYFYSGNEGDPLVIAKDALIKMRDRYKAEGVKLEILGVGTTGYGELLFSKAFNTEYHTVETVAHAKAASHYVGDVDFLLDIGGQDMKAIWLSGGVITNIIVNEACSSGCGSFLQNFADSLGIEVKDIAEAAFSSQNPAVLGSRCTVFMTSSIVTEQRNGKSGQDIMAGLCRSIIENVFTKVIRMRNLDSLGKKIVVQGGTFQNDAVLRAMEQYIGRTVVRAPYPGIMGAIGVALLTKEKMQAGKTERSFIGLENLDSFTYSQQSNVVCPFCQNHCKRTIVKFSNGASWITNNRCERGEILGMPGDPLVREKIREGNLRKAANLFKYRQELLFKEYEIVQGVKDRGITIGLPRVLSFWELMPFWNTFFRSLGFDVKMSDLSTRKMFEDGLSSVVSDTVCFPAKLVHGHLRNLAAKKVDRIFMPVISTFKSQNTEETSEYMCAIVKGYSWVIRNSDNPEKRFGIPYDTPLFFWYTDKDKESQLESYMQKQFGIPKKEVDAAIKAADSAMKEFHSDLESAAQQVIDDVQASGKYAIVLASRPYQNDPLVNHGLPELFADSGIPVLTVDSVPGIAQVDLSHSRLDVVNNYHARLLATSIIAAEHPHLEYVQFVSFGCGHDAYLSDEIIRMMKEISGKSPLVLKMDESDVQGPLRIRVRSFVETLSMKYSSGAKLNARDLPDPYKVKFNKKDVHEKIVLVPNTSHAFARIMAASLATQKLKALPLDVGREDAIRLGKKYVHNDICFPAQIVIGEALAALESGLYDPHSVAIATGKDIGDCRLTHYGALLRKALDDAGYSYVPIVTNNDRDYHNLHPGFKMNLATSLKLAIAFPMIDALEELLRKMRPYELEKGSADAAFEKSMDLLVEGIKEGFIAERRAFAKAIEVMKGVKYDRSHLKPTVLIVGEYLLNFHPGANHDIELYLEENGFEIIEAKMSDVMQKTYFAQDTQIRENRLHRPLAKKAMARTINEAFNFTHVWANEIACRHPLFEPPTKLTELVKGSDPLIYHTFDAGEGVLIPGEILHHASRGCKNFIILQPFGCLPNHVVGRGITKRLKELYPDVQILPLDYDPDVSFANIENRLQMLIMNAKNSSSDGAF